MINLWPNRERERENFGYKSFLSFNLRKAGSGVEDERSAIPPYLHIHIP